jgi:hypothetical protein
MLGSPRNKVPPPLAIFPCQDEDDPTNEEQIISSSSLPLRQPSRAASLLHALILSVHPHLPPALHSTLSLLSHGSESPERRRSDGRLSSQPEAGLVVSRLYPPVSHLSDAELCLCLLLDGDIVRLLSIVLFFLWKLCWRREMEAESFDLHRRSQKRGEGARRECEPTSFSSRVPCKYLAVPTILLILVM